MRFSRWIASVTLLLAAGASHALDFKTIAPAAAILYDAPSDKGGKLFVAPRGMPVEVVLSYGEWVKVRDMSGDMAWLELKMLSAKRNVIARNANVKVRATADDSAAPILQVDKGVLLELVDNQITTWVKVRHRDGVTGFVKATDIWGI